ncbi:Fasciclin-like arabinogalactan protein 4 [Linum grandiflorum]
MASPPPPPILHPRFTISSLSYLYLLLLLLIPSAGSIDIATVLAGYPDFSSFSSLLASSQSLSNDISHRSSITLLAVPNAYLSSSVELTRHLSPSALSDLLGYHVLLQYFSWSDLRRVPPGGLLVTTLYQTTGRAPSNFGSVNVTRDPGSNSVSIHSPASYSNSNATVLSLVKSQPYNLTIVSVNSLLVPYGFNLMSSETRPPLGINITKALIDGHNFFVAASMLAASGVVDEFEADEGGAGITLFVPTDAAFADLPGTQPTLATEDIGAGRFTLNISRVNGSVAIDSGIVQASVTQTVFDQNPVAIFGVSRVLLPKEIFGKNPIPPTSKPGSPGKSDPPEASMSPEKSPDTDTPPSHLSSPPDFREDIKSGGGGGGGLRILFLSLTSPTCIVLLYLFL